MSDRFFWFQSVPSDFRRFGLMSDGFFVRWFLVSYVFAQFRPVVDIRSYFEWFLSDFRRFFPSKVGRLRLISKLFILFLTDYTVVYHGRWYYSTLNVLSRDLNVHKHWFYSYSGSKLKMLGFFSFSLSFFLCVKQMTRNFPNCLVIRQSIPWLLLGKVLWVSSLTHIYRHASFLHIEFLPSQHKQAFFGSGHDVLFQNDFTESRIYLDVLPSCELKFSSSWDEKHISRDKPSIARRELLSFEQYCSLS